MKDALQEDANKTIEEMNRLWEQSEGLTTVKARNKFVKCQQWLTTYELQYYQEPKTGIWKLAESAD